MTPKKRLKNIMAGTGIEIGVVVKQIMTFQSDDLIYYMTKIVINTLNMIMYADDTTHKIR